MKLLLISHNPICSYNGMGITFASLLSGFDPSELCQLYIYPSYPDMDRCASYYRVTDKEVLGSLFHRGTPGGPVPGRQIHSRQSRYEDERDEALYRQPRNKKPLRRLGRDLLWRLSGWYSPALRAWLERERPDRILVAPGAGRFLYDMALRISDDLKIPIAVYLCDEYYFTPERKDPAGRLQRKLLRKKMEELLSKASLLVTISEELRAAYSARFSLPVSVIMTGSTLPRARGQASAEDPQTLCYFGNVRSNRYRSLIEIGRCLDEINREQGSAYRLRIHTFEKDPGILGRLQEVGSIELPGFLQGDAFTGALLSAGVLIHVESFDKESMEKVKNSVSTKIADSLASGVPLLAYGPPGLASIEHLRRHQCAFLCTAPDRLRETLLRALTDREARSSVVSNALETAAAFHDSAENSRRLYRLLEAIGGDAF